MTVARSTRKAIRRRVFHTDSNFWSFVSEQEPKKMEPASILERLTNLFIYRRNGTPPDRGDCSMEVWAFDVIYFNYLCSCFGTNVVLLALVLVCLMCKIMLLRNSITQCTISSSTCLNILSKCLDNLCGGLLRRKCL